MDDYLQEEKNHISTLRKRLSETEAVNIQALARPDIPGAYVSALPIFEMIKNQILDVKALELSCVPYGQIETAASAISEANRLFHAILNVIAPSTPERTAQNISDVVNHWREKLAPALSNLQRFAWSESSTNRLARKLAELEARLKASSHDAEQATADAKLEKEKMVNDYQIFSSAAEKKIADLEVAGKDITGKLTETLAGLGAAEYMKRFTIEAREHRNNAQNWLYCVIAFGATIGLVILCYVYLDTSGATPPLLKHGIPGAISSASTKLLVMSVLSFGLFLSVRNYSACRHNYIVNKHRINALGTFKLFLRTAGDDEETKKAVLLQSMQAIFSPQSTGYLKGANEPQQNTHIIELIQSSLSKSTGGGH